MSTTTSPGLLADIACRFRSVRQKTLALCEPLTSEDMMVQSAPETSPTKWHIAHTAWFFESFILCEYLSGYQPFHPDFSWLFNSYYVSYTSVPQKYLRASFSRPTLEEVLRYREYVDEGIERLLEGNPHPEALQRLELGINHEEQHQELLLTDILHAFFTNPLKPMYQREGSAQSISLHEETRFIDYDGGLIEIGSEGLSFSFDNERPRHRVWIEPFTLASRLVTCYEYAEFIADGGYERPEFWLSAGWDAVQAHQWRAPLYWTGESWRWKIFTLSGEMSLTQLESVPVSHVSYFEADAYARWAGARLVTEWEWEAVTAQKPVQGNLLDSGLLRPVESREEQFFGDCWEWTGSAYLGYPGFQPLRGSLGEYNGKFMSGQMVLRGGSCVTPQSHIRATYRNFFSPETRWQFSGIRLAH